LGSFLKSDVEFVLNLNIPLTKLIKLKNTLKEILVATPELEFIEITDLKGYVLYYADHQSMGRVEPGTRRPKKFNEQATWRPGTLYLTPDVHALVREP
jgi:hypothetical protein